MGMQTDVLPTKPLTATGNFLDQGNNDIPRVRIKTIYCENGSGAGSVVIRQGGATGTTIAIINTVPSASAGYTIIPLPGEGILCKEAPLHGTITNTTSVTLVYG